MVLAVPSCLSLPFQFAGTLTALCDLHPRFSASCTFGFSFAFGAPTVVLSAAGSPLMVPRLSGYCFPCVSARFLSQGFHRLLCFSLLVPQAAFSPLVSDPPSACLWCSSLRLRFFFRRFCLALFGVALRSILFLTRSNLRFPSRRGLPLGRVRVATASVFLGLGIPACVGVLSVLSPFRSSALSASGVLLVSC